MSSRDDILGALRCNQPPSTRLPVVPDVERPDGDPTGRFIEAVRAVGGDVVDGAADGVDAIIAECYPDVDHVASTVAGVESANVRLDTVDQPQALAALDLLVCEGEFGVAENGAVWLDDSTMGHRAAPFLTQHLMLVLDRRQIVGDMHEAYARTKVDAPGFGLFVAGPSKTADIEQSLVMGAHGPRSLTVILVERNDG